MRLKRPLDRLQAFRESRVARVTMERIQQASPKTRQILDGLRTVYVCEHVPDVFLAQFALDRFPDFGWRSPVDVKPLGQAQH